jgi:hypothetical protein
MGECHSLRPVCAQPEGHSLTNQPKALPLDIPMCAAQISQREQSSHYAAHNGQTEPTLENKHENKNNISPP